MAENNSNPKQNLRGSQWHRWDLHVHTIASAFQHSFGDDWDNYVEKLIDAIQKHRISAIATADYFTIEGYRKLATYYNASTRTLSITGKRTEVLLVPGVELRLNIFNSEEESINLHVLFDPEKCSPDFIDDHFLEELNVSYRGKEHGLKTQALLAIGKSITTGNDIEIGEDFSSLPAADKAAYRKKALSTITLNKKDINEALKEIDEIFSQKLPPKTYLICAVGKGHGGINALKWFEDNKQFSRVGLVREDITHQADVIFSNSPNDRSFYLGENSSAPKQEIQARFRTLKPCVWGSDGHKFESLLHPSNGNSKDYTWIKAEISFEGLKQITYEPDLRVRIQEDSPADTETYTKIEKCTINFPDGLQIKAKDSTEAIDFCLRGKYEIHFSNNLTCVVGGRGSGKSTLVHLLYNSWSGREIAKLVELDSPLTDLELSKEPLAKVRDLVSVEIPANTEFFLQNEIEKFAKDIQQMSMLVRHRLERISSLEEGKKSLEQLRDDWSLVSQKVGELISAYDAMTSATERIDALQKQIATLKKQTEVIKSDEYRTLQRDIEQVAITIREFESYEREHKKVILDISTLLRSMQKLDWRKFGTQDSLDTFKESLEHHRAALDQRFISAKGIFDQAQNAIRLEQKKAELRTYLREKGMAPENIGELADATQQIATLEGQIRALKDEMAPSEEVYGRKNEILTAYGTSYHAYHSRFFEVSGKLQSNLAGRRFTEQEAEITFHARTNDRLLRDEVAAFIKEINTSKTVLSADSIETVLFNQGIALADLIADKKKITEAINKSEKATTHTQVLQEILSNEVTLEKLHLRMNRFSFDIENIQVQTKIGEKLLQNTSFGERCGIVIAIALVAGTNPIVIDQPEDNLDGRFISNVLVPLIRKQKQNRQIILVTRDANLVIGGDAELMNILEGEKGRTEVLPSTIENKAARSRYIWILDGGERAFQTREQKYSLA